MQDGTTVTVPWSGMSWARRYRNANSVGAAPKRAADIVKLKDIVRLRPNAQKLLGHWYRFLKSKVS